MLPVEGEVGEEEQRDQRRYVVKRDVDREDAEVVDGDGDDPDNQPIDRRLANCMADRDRQRHEAAFPRIAAAAQLDDQDLREDGEHNDGEKHPGHVIRQAAVKRPSCAKLRLSSIATSPPPVSPAARSAWSLFADRRRHSAANGFADSSSAISTSLNTCPRVKNRTPSGASSENPEPRPLTTSMISCVCDQSLNCAPSM